MNSFTCFFQGIHLDLRISNFENTSWWLLQNIATTTIFIWPMWKFGIIWKVRMYYFLLFKWSEVCSLCLYLLITVILKKQFIRNFLHATLRKSHFGAVLSCKSHGSPLCLMVPKRSKLNLQTEMWISHNKAFAWK